MHSILDDDLLLTIEVGERVQALSWSPSGEWIAAGGDNQIVGVWNAESGVAVASFVGHRSVVDALDWSEDSQFLLSGGSDGSARVWNVEAERRRSMPIVGRTGNVAWSPDGKRIAVKGLHTSSEVSIWNLDTGVASPLDFRTGWVIDLDWNTKNDLMLVGSANGYPLRVVDMSGSIPKLLEPSFEVENRVSYAAPCWSPEGERIALAAAGSIHVIPFPTGDRTKFKAHDHVVKDLAWSPDGRSIASASRDKTVGIWSPDGEEQTRIQIDDAAICLSWKPDGTQLAIVDGSNAIRIWDVERGDWIAVSSKAARDVTSIDWNPDSSRIVSTSLDRTTRIWNAESLDLLMTITHGAVRSPLARWSSDGQQLLMLEAERAIVLGELVDAD
ncbi:MAG: WD40 repeat domain-containing protein [Verrucomicrobiota bacterium]